LRALCRHPMPQGLWAICRAEHILDSRQADGGMTREKRSAWRGRDSWSWDVRKNALGGGRLGRRDVSPVDAPESSFPHHPKTMSLDCAKPGCLRLRRLGCVELMCSPQCRARSLSHRVKHKRSRRLEFGLSCPRRVLPEQDGVDRSKPRDLDHARRAKTLPPSRPCPAPSNASRVPAQPPWLSHAASPTALSLSLSRAGAGATHHWP
jgi:hypothetical protein